MHENLILGVFALLPLLLAAALVAFFRLFRQHRRTSRRAARLVAGNLLVLLFIGSICLLGGEIYYRFLYDTTDSFGLTKTTKRWFARHFEKNNAGVRDSVPYRGALTPGIRRVTFLGDSFTAGHGVPNVEDRFANLVRGMLPDREIHIAAHPGWDTGHQIEAVEDALARGYGMDTVVLVYCLNDIADIVPEWRAILERIYKADPPGSLVESSYLLNVWHYRLKAARDPDVSSYYKFVIDNYEGPVWERQAGRLRRMKSDLESHGVRLLVVTFPFLHALGDENPCREIHAKLARFWEAEGVPHLDLLSTFDGMASDDLVVNRYDAHPNEAAHAMAAEAIAEFLRALDD